jgi:hypothetical protein
MGDAKPTPADWRAELLRFTCFFPHPNGAETDTWWPNVMGEPPEQETVKPREGTSVKAGRFEHEGFDRAATINLSIEPHRADWVLGVPASEELPVEEMHLGSFPDVLHAFAGVMSGWLHARPGEFKRLALGAVLRLPVESREAGYELLSTYYLPFSVDPASSADFLYRINRPIESHVLSEMTKLNRLMTWSVMSSQAFQVRVEIAGDSTSEHVRREGIEIHNCRLELDINTAAERQDTLPHEALPGILDELCQQALLLAENGDRL